MADVHHGHCQTRENVELDFQRSRARHISSGSGNEIEDEALDPRVQVIIFDVLDLDYSKQVKW